MSCPFFPETDEHMGSRLTRRSSSRGNSFTEVVLRDLRGGMRLVIASDHPRSRPVVGGEVVEHVPFGVAASSVIRGVVAARIARWTCANAVRP
jgi:hypothetical protein